MKKEQLYIDASNGISGDMFVAAMLDLGADPCALEKALTSLPVKGFRTEISRVQKSGIDCCDFKVILEEGLETHDADMAYLYGHETEDGSVYAHSDEQMHAHDHSHESAPAHSHCHVHRNLQDILNILAGAKLTEGARDLAEKIFRILAEAEATAHGKPIEEVHFHEVGALDSIVDITAAAVCLDNLGIREVIIPRICEGSGIVRTQHGLLPIPVPAVVAISQTYSLPLQFSGYQGEYVTPTGAAIAAAIMTGDKLTEKFFIRKQGTGAGKRNHKLPGILRILLVETAI